MTQSHGESYLVIGGELVDVNAPTPVFKDTPELVGIYPTRQAAYDSWKASSWSKVDNAHSRFLILPLEGFAFLTK